MDYNDYGKLLIKLINKAVFGKQLDEWPESLNYQEFCHFCAWHKLENIAYLALKDLDISKEDLQPFAGRYNSNVCFIAMQQTYLNLIASCFDRNKVPFLILKGTELSKLYPSIDMRVSSDLDIYVGENSVRCAELMKQLGFSVKAFNEDNDEHDVYSLNGLHCEIHPYLIQGDYPWKEECNRIVQRLNHSETSMVMRMSYEDLYVYNLAHAAKHMKFSGVGVKVFLDYYLILKTYGDAIDWSVVKDRLHRAQLTEFDICARKLVEHWFESRSADEIIQQMEAYVFSSGFCGTHAQQQASEFARNAKNTKSVLVAKVSKCWEVFTLPYAEYSHKYPILKRYRLLTPIFRIRRIFSAALFKRDTVKAVFSEFDGTDMAYVDEITKLKSSVGL